MRPKCRDAIADAAVAAGRKPLTDAQFKAIEDGISNQMRRLGREDGPRWRSLTPEQQLREGAAAEMADIRAAATRKFENVQRQAMRVNETNTRVQSLQESYAGTKGHDGTRAEAVKRDFELTHIITAAEKKIAMGELMSTIEAAGDTKGAGIGKRVLMSVFHSENPTMTRDIVKEIFKDADGHTGNNEAKIAARAWLDTIEGMRTRFNAAGGDVGRLDYGWAPQPHDTGRVRKAGSDT